MIRILRANRIYILIGLVSILTGSTLAIASEMYRNSSQNTLPPELLEVRTDIKTDFPDLALTKYSSPETLVAYLSNRKVLLVVMSSSCGACKREIEVLESSNFLKNTDIEVALVGFENEEAIRGILRANRTDVPIFDDRSSKIMATFDLNFTPSHFLIVNGKVERMWIGAPQNIQELYAKMGVSTQ